MRILITSGGTKVPIDRVRDITNKSNGTFGSKIARAFFELAGNRIENLTFLRASNSKAPFEYRSNLYTDTRDLSEQIVALLDSWNRLQAVKDRYSEVTFTTFNEYRDQFLRLIREQKWDIILFAAAVSDYLVANYVDGKIRSRDAYNIALTDAEKIIPQARDICGPDCTLVGFKLLVDSTQDELVEAARHVLNSARCDFVVANDLRDIEAHQHQVLIVNGSKVSEYKQPSDEPEFLAKAVVDTALTYRWMR